MMLASQRKEVEVVSFYPVPPERGRGEKKEKADVERILLLRVTQIQKLEESACPLPVRAAYSLPH